MRKQYVKGSKATKQVSKPHSLKAKHRAANYLAANRDFNMDDNLPLMPRNTLPLKPNLPIPDNPQKPTFKRDKRGAITWVDSPSYNPPTRQDSDKVAALKARYQRLAKQGKRLPQDESATRILYSFKTEFQRTGKSSFKRLTDKRLDNLEPDTPPTFK